MGWSIIDPCSKVRAAGTAASLSHRRQGEPLSIILYQLSIIERVPFEAGERIARVTLGEHLIDKGAPAARPAPQMRFRGGRLVEKNLEYRARAAECTARADEATDPRIKAFNQGEAEMWLRLAEMIEEQGGRGTA